MMCTYSKLTLYVNKYLYTYYMLPYIYIYVRVGVQTTTKVEKAVKVLRRSTKRQRTIKEAVRSILSDFGRENYKRFADAIEGVYVL